ncbi:MAG TPA: 50S ribosomal protein L24 [Planctomycetaceae bacterium]|nr:50S ribosomal protein L24 [Planctomycetaceae bacterium]
MRVNKDDVVLIRTGADRGERARVVAVDREKGTVVVEGVNVVHKHVRRSRRNPQGGRLTKEMPMAMGNVQVVCPSCSKPTRVGARFEENGAKFRVCKKCGAKISQISPARKK